MSYLAWFDEIPEAELALAAGGKGASLCRLTRGGLPVPGGFVVRADMFHTFMQIGGLRDRVLEQIDSIDFESNADLAQKAADIRHMIETAPMPADMEAMIRRYYAELGADLPADERGTHPVAVRSSGTAEDLDDASFAGQQETFLYVMGAESAVRHIQECWASLYNDRAIFYRREKNFDERDISIAVVVQRMVAAIKSGVMFTAHPITQDRDTVLIEGSWGLGEAVVSGIVTPDSYTVGKDGTLRDVFVACKETMIARRIGEPGVEEREVPEERQEVQVLTEAEIRELAGLAVKLEAYFGKPQDVEWAIEAGRLYLLQSRPITTLVY